MRPKLFLAGALLLLPILLAACGGSGGGGGDSKNTPSASDATYQAALDEAKQTPVSDSMRAYAKQLCGPVTTFAKDTTATIAKIKAQPTAAGTVSLDDALTQGFSEFGQLKDPFQNFVDALNGIYPPSDLRTYHQQLIDEMDYAVRSVDAIAKNGFAGALSLPTQEATPENLPGFEAALVQECGEDLKPFFNEFGGDIFGAGGGFLTGGETTPTPPPPGKIGKAVHSGNFELLVNSAADPYTSTDESSQPPAGKRWILIDVSLKNVSGKSQDYGSFDFKLNDTDNFRYDSSFVNAPNELNFGSLLAGETIRGQLGYELPVDASPDRLIFEPGFFGEGRIDINMR